MMPVDDLPGMAFYYAVLREVDRAIGNIADVGMDAAREAIPRYQRDYFTTTIFLFALAPMSAVAALWAIPRLIALGLRRVRRPSYYEREKMRRQALAHERRAIRKRRTLNSAPTQEALLEQFARIRKSPREMLVFGSMLEDLEAYVDNSLVRDPDGTIVGRKGGIKQWLRENCPELGKRYHTVMRYKAMAKKFRQVVGLEDPVPASFAISVADEPIGIKADVTDIVGLPEMQLRYGQQFAEGDATKVADEAAAQREGGDVQLRCGQNDEKDGKRGCVVEFMEPRRFDMLWNSAYVAEGTWRMTRLIDAGEAAKSFLASCKSTRISLVEQLDLLLSPDRVPPEYRRMRADDGGTAMA